MSTMGDRESRARARIPFEALVEIEDGSEYANEPFEAQAVNVSTSGMQLRTAYLPDIGQPLVCTFDAGQDTVIAKGEVVWRKEAPRGGEFGIRFANVTDESAKALGKIVGETSKTTSGDAPLMGKVRLHIEGLASPMRARIKNASESELTVGSELGFLQVGKQLELENTETGDKRPAFIDRVEVEIDSESHIPRLVVALRYDEEVKMEEPSIDVDTDASEPSFAPKAVARPSQPDIATAKTETKNESAEDAVASMKSAFARGAAKVTPAVKKWMEKAREKAIQLSKRPGDEDTRAKRTTAPAPGGGLHTSGRKVVRGEGLNVAAIKKQVMDKRKVALAGAGGLTILLVAIALHKSPPPPQPAPVASAEPVVAAPVVAPVLAPAPVPDPMLALATPPAPTVMMPSLDSSEFTPNHSNKTVHVAPFTNGNVTHGNVLRLKMDGAIEKINGAAQPTGFTVSIPGHKSLEPAGPLAARDSRIASIRITNDGIGAELDVAFKDGVPNYSVRAKGDTLEIVLAPIATASHEKQPTHVVANKNNEHVTAKKHGK